MTNDLMPLHLDEDQSRLSQHLERLQSALSRQKQRHKKTKFLFLRTKAEPEHRSGCYLHGPAGSGKTMMMDRFYASLDSTRKTRLHYHHFMRTVHSEVFSIRSQDKKRQDPLPLIAKDWAKKVDIICLDEFFVEDITDAMILERLFESLIREGVFLFLTSNSPVKELYKDGLNRGLFLPFIDLISSTFDVLTLDGGRDYRLMKDRLKNRWLSPLSKENKEAMKAAWSGMTGKPLEKAPGKTINHTGRHLAIPHYLAGAAWFDFTALCDSPLNANDYLALVAEINTLFLDDLPKLSDHHKNAASRLAILIDILYDQHRLLICRAATSPEQLFTDCPLSASARTVSRLMEMQSNDYLEWQNKKT